MTAVSVAPAEVTATARSARAVPLLDALLKYTRGTAKKPEPEIVTAVSSVVDA